jgi:hypothetical protein
MRTFSVNNGKIPKKVHLLNECDEIFAFRSKR